MFFFLSQSGILIWSDLYLNQIFALLLSSVLAEADLLENIYKKPDIYIYLYFLDFDDDFICDNWCLRCDLLWSFWPDKDPMESVFIQQVFF